MDLRLQPRVCHHQRRLPNLNRSLRELRQLPPGAIPSASGSRLRTPRHLSVAAPSGACCQQSSRFWHGDMCVATTPLVAGCVMPPQLVKLFPDAGAILDWAHCYAVGRPPEATTRRWCCRDTGTRACAVTRRVHNPTPNEGLRLLRHPDWCRVPGPPHGLMETAPKQGRGIPTAFGRSRTNPCDGARAGWRMPPCTGTWMVVTCRSTSSCRRPSSCRPT